MEVGEFIMATLGKWRKPLTLFTLLSLSLSSVKSTTATQINHKLTQYNPNEYLVAQRCTARFMMVMTPDGGLINVRDRSNINGKVISSIPNRSVVLRKGWDRSGSWVNIVTDRGRGYEGWVWANYLTCGAD